MKNTLRLFTYILLNVLISAVTTFIILWVWEQNHPDCSPLNKPLSRLSQLLVSGNGSTQFTVKPTPIINATAEAIPPLSETVIRIDNIFGVGDLQSEVVVISRTGEGDLQMAGWQLVDSDGNSFTFPQLDLNKGSIEIYSRAGTSGLGKGFYWGSDKAVWRIGETARILDPNGNIRVEYVIP